MIKPTPRGRNEVWQNIAWAEVERLPEIARFAEQAGFHGVISGDHLFLSRATESRYPYTRDGAMTHTMDYPHPEVFTCLGAMAAATSRLHFSTSIYILPLRSPLGVAKAEAAVALLSNNRLGLGIGVGWQKEEFDAVGLDFHT